MRPTKLTTDESDRKDQRDRTKALVRSRWSLRSDSSVVNFVGLIACTSIGIVFNCIKKRPYAPLFIAGIRPKEI